MEEPLPSEDLDLSPIPTGETPREFTLRGATVGGAVGLAASFFLFQIAATEQARSLLLLPLLLPLTTIVTLLTRRGGRTSFSAKGDWLEATFAQSVAVSIVACALALALGGASSGWASALEIGTSVLFGGGVGALLSVPLRRFFIVERHAGIGWGAVAGRFDPEGERGAWVVASLSSRVEKASLWGGVLLGFCVAFLGSAIPTNERLVLPSLFAIGFLLAPRHGASLGAGWLLAGLFLPRLMAHRLTVGEYALLGGPFAATWIAGGGLAAIGVIGVIRWGLPSLRSYLKGISSYRVRFEIGGAGTQVEDMTVRVAQDMKVLQLAFIGGLLMAVALFTDQVIPADVSVVSTIAQLLLWLVLLTAGMMLVVSVIGAVGWLLLPLPLVVTSLGIAILVSLLGDPDDRTRWIVMTMAAMGGAGGLLSSLGCGFRLGGTPKRQQGGALLGVIIAAVALPLLLLTLRSAPPSPLLSGMLIADEPSGLLALGGIVTCVGLALKIPILPLLMGALLSLGATASLMAGALARSVARRRRSPPSDGSVACVASGLMIGELLALGVGCATDFPRFGGDPFGRFTLPIEAGVLLLALAVGFLGVTATRAEP